MRTSPARPAAPVSRTRGRWGLLVVVLVAVVAFPGPMSAATRPSPASAAAEGNDYPGVVAVRFHPGRVAAGKDRVSHAANVHRVAPVFAASGRAGDPDGMAAGEVSDLDLWHFVDVDTGRERETARALRGLEEVAAVTTMPVRQPAGVTNDTVDQWFLNRIQAPQAWDVSHSAATVRIAVIDTQFETSHPDLASKLVTRAGAQGVEQYTTGCPWSMPHADHGTSVAGLAAAVTNNAQGVAGVGYDAKILAMQVGSAYFDGTTGGLACAVSPSWVQALKDAADAGAPVVNMSFVGAEYNMLEAEAIRYAASKGALLVAAAGNDGTESPSYPAAYPEVLAVNGTDSVDDISTWSTRGNWIGLAAPDEGLATTCPNSTYCSTWGTSFAAPVVSGTAALAVTRWQGWPGGTGGLRLRHRLQDTADDVDGVAFDAQLGHGRVNARRAVTQRTIRIWGPTRVETTAEIAGEARQGTVGDVVLVPSDSPGDTGWLWTLPAAGLLGVRSTTFVMTPRAFLASDAEQTLNRLFGVADDGINLGRTVYIAGDADSSISQSVQNALSLRFSVRRVDGGSPYGTAAKLADLIQSSRATPASTVLIAQAENPADAISFSGPAAKYGYPLLFVEPNRMPAETCGWLGRHPEITTVGIAGGTAAVSSSVEQAVRTCRGAQETTKPAIIARSAGLDRSGTSLAIAQRYFPTPQGIMVANGWRWPDAVAGGAMSLSYTAPILLTDGVQLSTAVSDYIRAKARDPIGLWILGGDAVMNRFLQGQVEGLTS